MNAIPKEEYGRFKSEGRILLRLLSVELDKHNKENPDWSNVGILLHLRHDLKRLLTDMRLKHDSDEVETGREIEQEIAVHAKRETMTEYSAFSVTYMPENSEGITEGYYSMNGIVELLRKHKNEPEKIQFIADMLEE